MAESTINASLDAYLHGAQEGDLNQARQLHELLDQMLTERETADGRMWLTDHARMLLAEMHRKLALCESGDQHLGDTVLDAVQFKPHKGHWRDTCSFLRDLRVATTVVNELCHQRDAGKQPDLDLAVEAVVARGEFDLEAAAVREVFDEIASTVGGFREISRC
jgi:hypothetical protein